MTNHHLNQELFDLIKRGFRKEENIKNSLSDFKKLIDNGAEVDCKNSTSGIEEPILTAAILFYNVEVVNLLLSEGADPNTRCIDKYTPLHFLVGKPINSKSLEMAELLLEKGADLNLQNHDGRTALQVLENNLEKTPFIYPDKESANNLKDIFINEVKKREAIIQKHICLISAILYEVEPEEKIIAEVKELISEGADINYSDCDFTCAINYAVTKKYYDLTSKLIDWGADIDNCKNDNPAAAPFLNAITETKDPKMVNLLMEKVDPKRFKDKDSSFLVEFVSDTEFNTNEEKEEMLNIINTTKYINPVIIRFNSKKEKIKKLGANKRIGGFSI